MPDCSSALIKQVPPKLCVALLSDKAMRDTCKSFGLPATGRKEVCSLLQTCWFLCVGFLLTVQ